MDIHVVTVFSVATKVEIEASRLVEGRLEDVFLVRVEKVLDHEVDFTQGCGVSCLGDLVCYGQYVPFCGR